MKTFLSRSLVLICLLALVAPSLQAAEEQDLIATLQSNAGAPQKWAACQRLRMIGTPQAVPALATLLTDARPSQAARHALEALPGAEAGAALREALGKTSGPLKAGIIDSLGWRAESATIPLLAPLLTDPDSTIAAAAAGALGRIDSPGALAALRAARDAAPAAVQPAVHESLLKCAERLLLAKDNTGATAVYRDLLDSKYPAQVRTAAWRGLALADSEHRVELMSKALAGSDLPIQAVARKVLLELSNREVIRACLDQWNALPVASQRAVLEAQVKLGSEALPTARMARQSPDAGLRAAAWQALGDLNDAFAAPALAKAAAQGEPVEREAARNSLIRLRGPNARSALLAGVESAAPAAKAELLRALGDRGDRQSVDFLLDHAAAENPVVCLAALESLRKLAPAEGATRLLAIAAQPKSNDQHDAALSALCAICDASPDKAAAARQMVEAIGRCPTPGRRQVLPLLAELGTADALATAQAASRDSDPDLAKEAVRVLALWPTAAPASHLLELARTGAEPAFRTLALRGAIQVASHETDATKRFPLLTQALALANRVEEKRQALGLIGQVPSAEALDLTLKTTKDADLASEACLAAVAIAEKLAPANPKLADAAANQVLALVKEGEIFRRAWALRLKPSSAASFIRDWMVSGPYRQDGASGAVAVFNVQFDPEKADRKVEWKLVPAAEHVNLSGLFPGQDNCAAYLRTRIIAPQDCNAVLLMGSDDGVKAWLNGEVVHSNNVDRGEVVDQDAAPIKLKKGANDLMLKISQGGGGWSVSARIVGPDGKPIPGLMAERPVNGP